MYHVTSSIRPQDADIFSGKAAIDQQEEEFLARQAAKPEAKGMKRIILIKDKNTMASWGFAFVEFVDVYTKFFGGAIKFLIFVSIVAVVWCRNPILYRVVARLSTSTRVS